MIVLYGRAVPWPQHPRDGRDWLMARIAEAANKADIIFAMYAREDIPLLLAEIDRLRAAHS